MLILHLAGPEDLPRSLQENPPQEVQVDPNGQEAEPLRPPALGIPEEEFHPRYAPGPSLRWTVLAVRPAVSYDTREYGPGVYSGAVDFKPGTDLPRWVPGAAFSLDLGSVRVDAGFVQTSVRLRLDRAVSYEEETFPEGETVDLEAQAGWLDAAYRVRVAGGEGRRAGLSALLGVDVPRVKLAIESGSASAREGFNALWPVPVAGLEAHAWLTDRLRIYGSLLGTRVRFTNPFKEDGGEPQHLEFTYFRLEAGIVLDLSASWSLTLGATRFFMDVTQSSRSDDKDRAMFSGDGLFLGLDFRF